MKNQISSDIQVVESQTKMTEKQKAESAADALYEDPFWKKYVNSIFRKILIFFAYIQLNKHKITL